MLGPKFGYYPEASKSWLIVKEKAKQRPFTLFKDTAIKITTQGQRHLRAVFSSPYLTSLASKSIQAS